MRQIRFVPPTDAKLQQIADGLEPSDRTELLASRIEGEGTVFDVLKTSREISHLCMVAEVEGEPLAVFGIAMGDPSGAVGVPWAVFHEGLRDYPREMMRASRDVLKSWCDLYPSLVNIVHTENERAIKWLIHLGFSFDEEPIDVNGHEFIRFHV